MSGHCRAPRSYLFVPGDSARKMDKATASNADAVILDLEDSVAPARKHEALRLTRDFLAERAPGAHAPQWWVRINIADAQAALNELATLPLARIAGIIHPKLEDAAQLDRLGHWLDALETRDGVESPTGVIAIITETPAAIVGERAATLARGHARLRGYSWGAEDLSAAIGRPPLPGTTDADRHLAQAMRRHCLLMARAAGVDAIDSVSVDFHDLEALSGECAYARELGYVAKMAIHPAQIETINAGLAPSPEALDWARRVRALVNDNPDAAALQLDGRMVDQPHLDVAARILARSGER